MVSQKISVLSIFVIFFAIYFYYDNPLINSLLDSISNIKNRRVGVEKEINKGEFLFTKAQLAQYDGEKKPKMYLAVMGEVFDVTKGAKHYEKGSPYNVFIGRDATRSFVTGEFKKEAAVDVVHDFNSVDLRSVNHWVNFYKKDYQYVGKLIGRYYDENGERTKYGEKVLTLINEAEQEKLKENEKNKQFPPCNVEFDQEKGTRVWCTERSGGIKRDWSGYPRQLYEPEKHAFRCACVENYKSVSPNMKDYEGCDIQAISCYVKADESKNET